MGTSSHQFNLNARGFDLSDFNSRVTEIGFYVYQPVSVVGGGGGLGDYTWEVDEKRAEPKIFLKFSALSPDSEPLLIDLSDPAVEKELRERVQHALLSGEEYLEVVPNHLVPVTAFPRYFLRPAEETNKEDVSKTLTVQVLTNIDTLEYGANTEIQQHSFHGLRLPLTLAPGITLRDYQMEGYQKIGHVAMGKVEHASGFLLADDMGLGKTLQVLTVLARLIEEGRTGPFLIVAKPILLENWQREMYRFFPNVFRNPTILNSTVTYGDLKNMDIVLSSYDQLRRRQLDLARIKWDTVILDEAQKIKDPSTQTTRASWALPATTRIAMTGTPIENSLTDLWSIANFFQPGLLDSLSQFQKYYQDNEGNITNKELLKKKLEPIFLRRTKSEVASELLPVEEKRIELKLSEHQLDLYNREIKARKDGVREPLDTVRRLLRLSSHASLVDYNDLWPCDTESSPKLFETLNIIKTVQELNEKVLIFTRFISAQIALQLSIHGTFGIDPPIINGATKRRQEVIDRFSAVPGFNAMILSPDAAGVGLNITAANHVIHFTRSWNPAIEQQSTDRVHRLGQTKPVTVYLPIMVHPEHKTIEQRLDELLKRKRAIFFDIFASNNEKRITLDELLGSD